MKMCVKKVETCSEYCSVASRNGQSRDVKKDMSVANHSGIQDHWNVVDLCDERVQHNGVGPHRWAKLTTCTGSAGASECR